MKLSWTGAPECHAENAHSPSIQQLASKRWQVRYTGPTARRYAPHTFETRVNAEAWVVAARRKIDKDQWDATDDDPKEQITFGVYAARWLANRQVAGRPIKARTREHYSAILDDHLLPTFGHRQLAAIKPKDVRDWHDDDARRPADDAQSTPTACCARSWRPRSTTNCIDANPARIVGAGRAKRVHKIRPASVAELGVLTEAMPERLRLMVTLASWCALRFGETVELRRGDIDLSAEVIRIRRAAVRTKGAYSITTPKSDAGVRDVAIPPHIIPLIEAHLAKYVGRGRDSLIFPADNGGHLQPSTLYRHWYKAATRPAGRSALARSAAFRRGAGRGDRRTLAELMARLGHSTPQAAMRYQHAAAGPRPRDRGAAVEAGRQHVNRRVAVVTHHSDAEPAVTNRPC